MQSDSKGFLPNKFKTEFSKESNRFRLSSWIMRGYSIPIFLSFFSTIAVFVQTQAVRQGAIDVKQSTEIEVKISEFNLHIQVLSQATRAYLLDANQNYVSSYQQAKERVQTLIPELEQLIVDEQQKETFEKIVNNVVTLNQNNDSLIALVDGGKRADAVGRWRQEGLGMEGIRINNLLNDFTRREDEIIREKTRNQEITLNWLIGIVLATAALSILLAVIVGSWIINNINRRMTETASIIATSTHEIASTIEQHERTASQQAASVNQTTTTIDELGASSRQSAEQAEAAASGAQQALRLADGGTQAVEETLVGMNVIKEKVAAIAAQILELSEQTNQIGNISQLVSDLANQTNMLALNAAVEAVRAGEHGKGFSVVASEIRKLADRSKQSAQKINDLVTDVQASINSTVMVTDEGSKTVENSVKITQKTSEAFAGVAQSINNVVLNNQQISLNIRQQASAIQQIVEAMNSLNQGAKETASGIVQTKIGTKKLNEATQYLQEMI